MTLIFSPVHYISIIGPFLVREYNGTSYNNTQ